MIQISITQILAVTCFFAGSCISLIIYIYSNQTKRINKLESIQAECPINKIYTVIETVKTDVTWIKESIKKKI
jgi:hypothetical protein